MSRLKTIIDANIKENGNQEITGKTMNYVLTEIANDVNTDGYFPNMSVGFADNLVGRGESVPAEFTFRATGGKSIKDGAARIKRIKGNSVVWNQSIEGLNLKDGARIIKGHMYLMGADFGNAPDSSSVSLYCKNEGANVIAFSIFKSTPCVIATSAYSGVAPTDAWIYAYVEGEASITNLHLIDLTQMFGAGNEPTTIEEFNARKPIVADEYAFNEGEVIHCNTERIKSVGDNAWDEQWELGIIISNGENYELEGYIRSKNYIPIIGGEDYHYANRDNNATDYLHLFFYDEHKVVIDNYPLAIGTFTTPINARYMRFYINDTYGTTYKNDIIISLVHSGWKAEKDDQYQPYWQDTLPLPIIRKYFPQGMKSAGSAHDEIRFNKASGKWEKVVRIGSVDLGTFDYNLDSRFDNAQFYCDTSLLINNNIRCGRYITIEGGWDTNKDKSITRTSGGQILIVDSAYTDAASFKAAMQGVILYYELAEPIITEIDEPIGTDYRVADFGTEQAISSIPSAPFSADIIYQFNAVDMIRELWLKVQELESRLAQL